MKIEAIDAGTTWWRAERPAESIRSDAASRIAFGALLAFTSILLLSPQAFVPALKALRIALLSGGLAIVVYVVDATVRRRTVMTASPEVAAALTLLGWTVLTIPFSLWPGGSIALLNDVYLKAIIFFWLIAVLVTTRQRLETFAWVLVACSIPLGLIALRNFAAGVYVTSRSAAVQRIAGVSNLTGNPNDLALTLNLFIPLAGVMFMLSRSWRGRAMAAAALLLSVAAVIVTFSRAGFLTLCATAFMALFFFARRQRLAPAVGLFVLAACALPFLPQGYVDRLNTITDIEADRTGSAQGRWTDLHLATQVVAEHPVIGVGLGQDILVLDTVRAAPSWRSVHNAFLEIAVDLGIPGLLLFVGLLVASFRTAARVKRRSARDPALRELHVLAAGVQVALVAFVVGAFFAPIAYQFYFFCVAGLAVALKNAYRADAAGASAGACGAPAGAA